MLSLLNVELEVFKARKRNKSPKSQKGISKSSVICRQHGCLGRKIKGINQKITITNNNI